MMEEELDIDPQVMLSLEMRASLETFTKVMFKAQYNKSFIVSDHHRQIFNVLEQVVDGKINKLMVNMPPRYGKTEIGVKNFIAWCFALNPRCKFLHLSYSDTLVYDNSDCIKSCMLEPIYSQLFPKSRVPPKKQSAYRWKTEAGGELYAVPTQGQVTGFGAGHVDEEEEARKSFLPEAEELFQGSNAEFIFNGAILIDDIIKPEDAMSDLTRNRINSRFETTLRNRVNSRNTPIIIFMQRTHEEDICGFLSATEKDDWHILSLPAISKDEFGNDVALWPHKHQLPELYAMQQRDPVVFGTQYMQDPTPKEGLMYPELRTYKDLPPDRTMRRKNYTDTADTGSDYLCSICYNETAEGCYITDVLYTKKPMEFTEPATANMLSRQNTQTARIESNNGGRGFGRSVEKHMRSQKNLTTKVVMFTQTLNKQVRIYNNSAAVANIIFFPQDWQTRWPEFYKAVKSYRKELTTNRNDDVPDALTGIVEDFDAGRPRKKPKRRN